MKIFPVFFLLTTVCLLVIPRSGQCGGQRDIKDGQWFTVCSKQFFRIEKELSWYQAVEFCNKNSLKLVSIDSSYKQECLKEYATKGITHPGGDYTYWTSGNNLGKQNQYQWKSTGEPFEYTSWASGKPDHWTTDARCVKLVFHYRGSYDTKWVVDSCSLKMFAFCE